MRQREAMLSELIKKIRQICYGYPDIYKDRHIEGNFGSLKIALITDYLTAVSLSYECRIRCLTPGNYQEILKEWKPDFLFVESSFHGYMWTWSYSLARRKVFSGRGYLKNFIKVIQLAKDLNIPTVFWNKDDGDYFDTFIEAASLCDYVYTADSNSLSRYMNFFASRGISAYLCDSRNSGKESYSSVSEKSDCSDYSVQMNSSVKLVGLLPMAVQPKIHSFTGFNFSKNRMCFLGSYYRHILKSRRSFLDSVFTACKEEDIPVDIYDRNSRRLSHKLDFSFPGNMHLNIFPKVSYEETAEIYKSYNVCLNVNSVTASQTMCSRRLLEILACGGIVVTNPSQAVTDHFSEYCTVINSYEEAKEILPAMVGNPSPENMEKARAGSEFIANHHTWTHRLEQIAQDVGL